MDIAGAKALKTRIGPDRTEDARPAPVDVPEDAPPVFHWFGTDRPEPEVPSPDAEEEPAARSASLFRRLGL